MAQVDLLEIIRLPAFGEAADLFYRVTGMTLSFPRDDGEIEFRPFPARCDFCRLVQSSPEGLRRCTESDRRATEVAMKQGRPMFYTCHSGLVDVVVPLKQGDEEIGCFFSGQSLLSPPTEIGFEDTMARLEGLGLNREELREAYRNIPRVDPYKLEMALELLGVLCNHLLQGRADLRRERELTKAAEQRARLEREIREMELRLSLAQWNPHFLFNSLNLILGEAQNEQAPRTAQLVEELSAVLGHALTTMGQMVALSTEFSNAEAYVDIFRARFGKAITFTSDLPRPLASLKVPALTLQPLVENSLVHAFPKSRGPFRIALSAGRNGSGLQICVRDNGPAWPPSELASVRRSLGRNGAHRKLTGLPGLKRRLECYFDQAVDVTIDQADEGTTVALRLPL